MNFFKETFSFWKRRCAKLEGLWVGGALFSRKHNLNSCYAFRYALVHCTSFNHINMNLYNLFLLPCIDLSFIRLKSYTLFSNREVFLFKNVFLSGWLVFIIMWRWNFIMPFRSDFICSLWFTVREGKTYVGFIWINSLLSPKSAKGWIHEKRIPSVGWDNAVTKVGPFCKMCYSPYW